MAPQRSAVMTNGDMIAKTAVPVLWLASAFNGQILLSSLPAIIYVALDGSTGRPASVRAVKTWLALALAAIEILLATVWLRSSTIVFNGWIAVIGVGLLLKPG